MDYHTNNPKDYIVEIENPDVVPSFSNIIQMEKIPEINYGYNNYQEFFTNNLLKNVPCIIKNVSKYWSCMCYWVRGNEIQYTYLHVKYGSCLVPVADCKRKYFNSHYKKYMFFNDYLDYLKQENREEILYLKDWHCQRLDYRFDTIYEVPYYFASDWLNEYAYFTATDDYMFVYIGGKGSWTPFHVDVYNSYSWSANIMGKKKWRLYPPGEEHKLRDNLGNLPFDCSDINNDNVKYYEIIQNSGDAIFVPSGWYHQVWNLEDTISVNHNWINGCNVHILWENMQKELMKVEKEIADCSDMEDWAGQCQVLLKATFGMDFTGLYKLLTVIANRRLVKLKESTKLFCFNYISGVKHCIFDIRQIRNVLQNLKKHSALDTLADFEKDELNLLLVEINEILDQMSSVER